MAKQLREIQTVQTELIKLIGLDLAVKTVFKNTHTLRLTKVGQRILSKSYDNWVFESPKLNANNLINLLRKMRYPYYIDKDKLILYTERDAFLAKFAGAQGWLDGK
jgi:hypothetical protein|tara:strand:- start:504 stop:821 length:318 start_codon:yes stop_codon:yes gene_type:complete